MTVSTVTPAIRQRAELLAEQAPTWHRGRSKVDGRHFYLVPGSAAGVVYYSSHLGCTCPGFRHRGVCAHQQAALILVRRAEARLQMQMPDFGPCTARGCARPATGKARRCDAHFAELIERLGI
jgi:hypothetical protein